MNSRFQRGLSREQLLVIKEQFKSVHNVMPYRFMDLANSNEVDKGRMQRFSDGQGLRGELHHRSSFMTKLPDLSQAVANQKNADKAGKEQNSSRSQEFDFKKYNYTKNSLNCIPLSNRFRQIFIRFVEWKHQGDVILVFVAINSIFLGIVDYRFKGNYSDPDAPLGNYLLGITEPIYAVLFTAEALVKIIGQGFILSKKTYLRDPWNMLDFAVVITALLSFSPDISSVSILRAFRLFKPLRNLQVFPSMRLLMRTLVASANRLRFLIIFYIFVIMIFSIIGVNLMQGITTFRCRQTKYPENGDWLPVVGDEKTCGWAHTCEIACGTLYYPPDMIVNGTAVNSIITVSNLRRDSTSKAMIFGYTTFDNIYQGCLTLFQLSTLQDWYKILYLMQDAYNSYISGIFFVIYIIVSNYFMHILTIGIMMQRFIELNDHRERQEIYQQILGLEQDGEPVNIEDLKNKFREEQKKNKEQLRIKKQKSIKDGLSQFFQKLSNPQTKPVPQTRYHQFKIPQLCWRLNNNIIYETFLTFLAILNAFTLAFLKYPDDSSKRRGGISVLQDNIDYITAIVAVIFFFDQLLKFIGQGIMLYIKDYENALYSFTSVASLVHIGMNGGRASPITACTMFKVFKILRRSNYSQTFDQLIDSILYTLSVMLSYSAIMVLFVYIFSLLGMQFFAGKLLFNAKGEFDLINGTVPRQNFDTLAWAVMTVLQTIIGDDWSEVMFNCMLATGWYACIYFILLIIVGYIVLMNLFLAILIGNFEEASLIMRDTKFLKTIQKANDQNKATTQEGFFQQNTLQKEDELDPYEIQMFKPDPIAGAQAKTPPPIIKVDNFTTQASAGVEKKALLMSSVTQKVDGMLSPSGGFKPQNTLSKSVQGVQLQSSFTIAPSRVEPLESKLQQAVTDQKSNQGAKQSQEKSEDDYNEAFSDDLESGTGHKGDQGGNGLNKGRTVLIHKNDDNEMILQHLNNQKKIVVQKRQHPFKHHIKNSSCCLLNKKHKLRQNIFKIVVDPDHLFPDNTYNIVQLEEMDGVSRRELLSMGFRKKEQSVRRTSGFFSINFEAVDTKSNNQDYHKYLKQLRATIRSRQDTYNFLHKLFNYVVSTVIFINTILLLLSSPLNDPNSVRTNLVLKMDLICTLIFIFEVTMKIISIGFFNTCIEGQRPFIFRLWNVVDLLVLILSVLDIIYVYPAYDGLFNCMKCIRIVHLLKLFKKNDLLEIIVQTMYRSLKPIMITLLLTFSFIFMYGLIGVNLFRGAYNYCERPLKSTISQDDIATKFDCLNYGSNWIRPPRNFDNIFSAMLTLFEMMSSEDWLTPAYMGIDSKGIDLAPVMNSNQAMLLYFLPYMIIGHIFIWRMFGGVMIENFNRARDKFYDYALMTSEQRNWVEMQRSLIEKRLRVRIDETSWSIREGAQKVISSPKFELFILGCIFSNTTLQAITYYGNPPVMQTVQDTAGYIFAAIFNIECFLKMLALGKYYFWESHNIFDFALIIGTNLGILLTMAFPNFSIGPLATLLRAFRIGRILRLLKEKKSLKMLIDTIFYIFPILINIVGFMFLIILIYSVIGIHLFAKVMHQKEINSNANFQSLGGALLLLFRVTTGEKWNLLMREFALKGAYLGTECLNEQSFDHYIENGPMMCGSDLSYLFFLTFVVIMQLMVVNLFIAIVLEGFAQFSIQNNSIVGSHDYENLIEIWSHYDPTATGWIKPKHLAFLMYELPAPLGKQEDYKEILKKTLDHNTMIKQYSDKKAINMKTKFIYNEQKGLILPHSTVLKLLIDLQLPVYNFEGNSVCHFKDVCLTATKKALQRNIDSKKDITENRRNIELQFDRIPEEQQKRLDEGWRQKYKNLQRAQLIDDYDTGKLWAGLYILKMMRSVNNGFGRTQFKKKLAQSRLFKKLQKKHHIQRGANVGEKIVDVLKKTQINEAKEDLESEHEYDEEDAEEKLVTPNENGMTNRGSSNQLALPNALGGNQSSRDDQKGKGHKGSIGGPQGRGRSPSNKLRDHQKSTWWMQNGPDSLGSGNTGSRSNQVAPAGHTGWTNTIEITSIGQPSPKGKKGLNQGDKSSRRR